MTRNAKPHIPVVGEFHFSRFAYLQWEEELLKMKAGGVSIVASYVFWNFHEEQEGEFIWSGNLNLRHFVDLCGKHELPLIVRIGPFCHGEVRNGGCRIGYSVILSKSGRTMKGIYITPSDYIGRLPVSSTAVFIRRVAL